MDCWLKGVQIAFYLGSLGLAFYTLIYKRNEVFRNTLQNRQIDELGRLREKLFDVWFDIYYVKGFADNIHKPDRSIVEFQREQPDDWEQYQRYKKNSLAIFYKLGFEEYYLFPSKFDPKALSELRANMEGFAPFTIANLIEKDWEQIKYYQNLLLKSIGYFDKILRQYA